VTDVDDLTSPSQAPSRTSGRRRARR
jgi:hypothetical protein